MGYQVPAMRRQRERSRSDRAYVILNGRRVKLGVWGSEKAEQRYRQLIAGVEVPKPTRAEEPPARPTVVEVMAPFMLHVVEQYPGNEAEVWHYKAAMRILKAETAGLPADEFGPRRLRAVREVMVAKGWSRKYVNGQISRVRRMFRWAVADERLPPEVYQALAAVEGLRAGRTDAAEPQHVAPVDDAVVDATLPYLKATAADMVAVQRLCGCRPGELCMMAAEFIDRRGEVWLFTPPSHKTAHHGKRRVIALGPRAQAILTKYLFQDGPFFPYDSAGYRQVIRRACDRAFPAPEGTKDTALKAWRKAHRWKPNQLRHSVATKVREQFGLDGAQHVLGHSSVGVTEIYAERNTKQAILIAKEVG